MNHPQPKKPNKAVQQLYLQYQEAWKRQDYQKGISLMEQAAQKEPSNPGLLLFLARLHGQRYDYAAAERCIQKALQVSQGNVKTLEEAGQVCFTFKQTDMMLGYLERASQKKGVSIAALTSLADIYLLDKRLDEAAEVIERAAWLDRKDGRVLLGQATIKQRRGEKPAAEAGFRELMMNPAADLLTRVRAAYRLAGLLDGEGQYDEAMSALLEGKALQRAKAAPLAAPLQQLQNLHTEMEQTITAGVLDRWRDNAVHLQPPRRLALLSGHPRSGTTLLEQVLDGHSDIISAEETNLFHEEVYRPLTRDFPQGSSLLQLLDSTPNSALSRARENYFHCAEMFLRQPIGNRLLVDKNPGVNIMVPLMARVFPETKFLVALRDPRDVVMSCFMQALQLTPSSFAYLSLGGTVNQYASVMSFWLEMFPRLKEQCLPVRYEDMVDDLPSVARTTLAFLGVGYEENVLKFHEHAQQKRVNSPTQADVTKPLYRTAIGRWRNYEKYLEPYLPELERFLNEFNYR